MFLLPRSLTSTTLQPLLVRTCTHTIPALLLQAAVAPGRGSELPPPLLQRHGQETSLEIPNRLPALGEWGRQSPMKSSHRSPIWVQNPSLSTKHQHEGQQPSQPGRAPPGPRWPGQNHFWAYLPPRHQISPKAQGSSPAKRKAAAGGREGTEGKRGADTTTSNIGMEG